MGIAPPPLGVGPLSNPGIPNQGSQGSVGYIPPPESTTETPEFEDNPSIVTKFTIYPWSDGTHEKIQPGMLLFISRFTHQKFKRVNNMAPLWKLNIDAREQFFKARNRLDPFKTMLEGAGGGDMALEDYHQAQKEGRLTAEHRALKGYYDAAQKGENRYLSRHGILSHWNFVGSCLSKGESTGAFSYMDMHDATDTMWIVGVTMGRRADISNIWGRLHEGDHLFLILRRVKDKEHFQFIPWIGRERTYPPLSLRTYMDASGRSCPAYILYVGLVVASRHAPPSQSQMDVACGLIGSVQQAYEAYGTLPSITVELGV